MRLRTLTTAAMLLSAAAAMSAHAQPNLTGNYLAERCGGSDRFCSGYVLGFASGLMMANTLRDDVCIPKGVIAGQMLDVVMAWIKSHPKERHFPAEAVVGLAFADAWPCKR
jgi:hypothetical protein